MTRTRGRGQWRASGRRPALESSASAHVGIELGRTQVGRPSVQLVGRQSEHPVATSPNWSGSTTSTHRLTFVSRPSGVTSLRMGFQVLVSRPPADGSTRGRTAGSGGGHQGALGSVRTARPGAPWHERHQALPRSGSAPGMTNSVGMAVRSESWSMRASRASTISGSGARCPGSACPPVLRLSQPRPSAHTGRARVRPAGRRVPAGCAPPLEQSEGRLCLVRPRRFVSMRDEFFDTRPPRATRSCRRPLCACRCA